MAKFEEHCNDCEKELGNRCEEVNHWLDELFQYVGTDHREIRHNEKGIEKARKLFGELGAKAATIHIIKDEGCIPKCDKIFMIRMAIKPNIHQAFLKEYEND